ncbi:hypothetical protein MBLNU459_g1224t1 [Dothideomycetes sp. NU459]
MKFKGGRGLFDPPEHTQRMGGRFEQDAGSVPAKKIRSWLTARPFKFTVDPIVYELAITQNEIPIWHVRLPGNNVWMTAKRQPLACHLPLRKQFGDLKRSIQEFSQSDQNDESLRKWKESLGIGSGTTISDPKDPRRVIILSLGLEIQGRDDVIIDVATPNALESLKSKPFTIKEGATFRMKARFKVQHQICSGMKYVQVVKRGPVSNKMQEMIGSYSPNTTDKPEYEKKFESETAPSGMMFRGHYKAVSKFVDDDDQTHLKFEWSFDIKKDW